MVEAYNSECSFCDVTHARPVVLNCQEVDRDTTTVTVTLLSQDTPPAPRRTLMLTFPGSTAQALICQGEDCLTGTTTTVPVSTDPEDTFPSLVVVSVVVAATVTLIVLLVVGLLIFLIRRTRRCYYWSVNSKVKYAVVEKNPPFHCSSPPFKALPSSTNSAQLCRP